MKILFKSMNFCSRRTNNRQLFVLLVLFYTACVIYIYYLHKQKLIYYTTGNFNQSKQHEYSLKINEATKFIQNILENEYNHGDLIKFYSLVQKEFSLGLKCTRNTNVSSSFVSSTKYQQTRYYPRTHLSNYIIDNSDACLHEPIDLLIIIMSKSENFKTRDAIRRTWGSPQNLGIYSSIYVKYFFFTDYDENLIENIRLENNIFHDIIQVELPQQYTLVTYRVLSIFEWSFRYCRTAKFLFKTDDDILINFILLLKFVLPLIKEPIDNSFLISDMKIYGRILNKTRRHLPTTSLVLARYIVTVDEFPCERYPIYVEGYGYLLSKKARDALVYAAYQSPKPPFRLSDVYSVGILPDYLSIPRRAMSNYSTQYSGSCEKFFNSSTAFACATGTHNGISMDVFQTYNQCWQIMKKIHGLSG